MYKTFVETQELTEMRENIRRSVEALELCWSCQYISECRQSYIDDGSAVWLCPKCFDQTQARQQSAPGSLFWPF
ncbi:MAG: hypothetical protein HY647_06885 [Acidobacteria bacterium]|nr:hypothetical protein [Acidobacteriota bacterium]